MTLPGKSSWGKIIGGILGLCLGGPFGAAAGIIIGHIHDQTNDNVPERLWVNLGSKFGDFSANVEQAVFTMGIIVLSAKMARASGQVSQAEIEAFRRVFNISPAQESVIAILFNRARQSADGFEPYAMQLAHVFKTRPAVLESVLIGLFIIAGADNTGLSPEEVTFLRKVSTIFGFSDNDFMRIAAHANVEIPGYLRPQNPVGEAFSILGVSETASAEEIKFAYHTLIRTHHPDKLSAEGMPPEFIATATEKMKRINSAYDLVGKNRGLK